MRMSRSFHLLDVSYGQAYLVADPGDESPDWNEFFYAGGLGILGVQAGHAIVLTGLHTGVVGFHLHVSSSDPGAELDTYEDVVEADFEARSHRLELVPWGNTAIGMLRLPAGPGEYRMRYHARGMDEAGDADMYSGDEPIDEYLLQVWPAEPAGERTLKITSARARYWQSDKRNR